MASVQTSSFEGRYLKLTVVEESWSIENNTSTIRWTLESIGGEVNYYSIFNWGVWVNGQTIYNTQTTSWDSRTFPAAKGSRTGTITVQHNNDGTAGNVGFTLKGSVYYNYDNSYNGSIGLTTIPRASEISSVSTVNIGEKATISVNRKSSSFTHTITYLFGNLSGTVVTKSSSTSIQWTIPNDFYTQIPNSKSGTGTLYITTYNGNTQIGDRKSKQFTVTTNESLCIPTIEASIQDINNDTYALTQNRSYFINGHSTVEVTYTTTAKNSSTISQVDANGLVMSGSPFTYTSRQNDVSQIVVTSKDSRGYSNSQTFVSGTLSPSVQGDYYFISYVPLTSNISVSRVSPTSDELTLSFSGNYYNGTFGAQNNTLTLSWKYREYNPYNPTDWETITANTLVLGTDFVLKDNSYHSGTNADYEGEISLGHLFDYRKDYEILFIASDKLENVSVIALGHKGIPVINWGKDFFNVNGDIRCYNKSVFGYSTDEHIVGVSDDGKFIYSKTFEFTTVAGTNTIPVNISDGEIDDIYDFTGTTTQPQGNKVPLSYYHATNDWCNYFYRDSTKDIIVRCGSSYGFGDVKMTIIYTKTTD